MKSIFDSCIVTLVYIWQALEEEMLYFEDLVRMVLEAAAD